MQFGLLLADGRNGPFRLEIQYVRALVELDRADYVSPTTRMLEEAAAREAAKAAQFALPQGGSGGGSGAVHDPEAAAALSRYAELRDKARIM